MNIAWLDRVQLLRASRLIGREPRAVLFVTSLLRAREIKMASALRAIGWRVVLIYTQTTPFRPDKYFDIAIRADSEESAHAYAKALWPRICHVFSGAVDGILLRFCRDKPGRLVVDLNDIFCPSLFDYCHDRFEPTRECLRAATALCARDLQAKRAQRLDGFELPARVLLFPEYSWKDAPRDPRAAPKLESDEVRVVSVGTFCLETHGMYDSCYLKLATMLTEQRIHLHIYPHWFYRNDRGSSFNWDLRKDFADFFRLQERTSYLHIHESLGLDELARVLPQYDFGIVAGGNRDFGQELKLLKPEYMGSCYSGRISDYLDARLPVLINPEVTFNDRLLSRYGIGVDLTGVLRPGFRECLLNLKHDAALARAVDAAAKRALSLERNIGRLAAFYEQIIEETPQVQWSAGIRLWVARQIPLLGKPLSALESAVRRLNQSEEVRIREERRLAQSRIKYGALSAKYDALSAKATYQEQLIKRLVERASTRDPSDYLGFEDVELNLEARRGPQWADEIAGLLNWPEIRETSEQQDGMRELLETMRLVVSGAGPLNRLSSCWSVLSFKNFNQLLRDGYRNFKRTIGCNYFNFLVQAEDPQIQFLESQHTATAIERMQALAATIPDDPNFDWHDQRSYRYFVLLLWSYARTIDSARYLAQLREPHEGNPVLVPFEHELASQDLANSLLEYYSMREAVDFTRITRVLEIGGGYGRDAFVILSLNPRVRYTLVDVPPAIWVAQRYLSSVFLGHKVFRVRDFKSFDEIRDEIESAQLVFLLPHQLAALPDGYFDLALNISSFGEMRREQIHAYLRSVARLTNGFFYMKQWKESQNAFDQLTLTEKDYQVSGQWTEIYMRTCRAQTGFFEALYRTAREHPRADYETCKKAPALGAGRST